MGTSLQWPDIDVAIPAYNEERSIAATIRSFHRQDYPGRVRLHVCANGCSDGTVAVLTALRHEIPRLSVHVIEPRGKPRAWNHLISVTDAPYICFADGDVLVTPETLTRLLAPFPDRPGLCATGARVVPMLQSAGVMQRILAPPAGPIHGLCGRLYLCERRILHARLQARGYQAMPEEVIHEDRWISYVIGRDHWTEAPGASVTYLPPTLGETVALYRRHVRGMHQFRRNWPALLDSEGPGIREYTSLRARGFIDRSCETGYGAKLAGFVLRRGISLLARFQVFFEKARPGLEGWETAHSTKDLITGHPQTELPPRGLDKY